MKDWCARGINPFFLPLVSNRMIFFLIISNFTLVIPETLFRRSPLRRRYAIGENIITEFVFIYMCTYINTPSSVKGVKEARSGVSATRRDVLKLR